MTSAELRSHTCKDLAQMAKKKGLPGWHMMRKEELVQALLKESSQQKREKKRGRPSLSKASAKVLSPEAVQRASRAKRRMTKLHSKLEAFKQLSAGNQGHTLKDQVEDRLVVMVRDPYWLHVYWELSPKSVQRSRSALGQKWHGAKPVLQLLRGSEDGSAEFCREIEIHGGVNNWYVDVENPPCSYCMEIGYTTHDGEFFSLAKSNSVTTPKAGDSSSIDDNWTDVAENADRIYAMSGGYSPQGTSQELQELLEQRLHRPMGSPLETRYGDGAARILFEPEDLNFAIDAEVVIYGVSHPNAHLTVKGEPIQAHPDGTFSVRLPLPDRRQIIPVVASSPVGDQQQTIILAVERNTKIMDPKHLEPGLIPGKR